MTFYEFLDEVADQLHDYLPEQFQNMEIEMKDVSKLNDRYTGLQVRGEASTLTPVVHMENMFEVYTQTNDMDAVLHSIADQIQSELEGVDLGGFQQYDQVKDKLFIRVSNAEVNKELLEGVPHTIQGDLAITYHIMVDVRNGEVGSAMITNQVLDSLGISKDQLHQDALENSPKILPARIEPLVFVLNRMFNQEQAVTPATFDEQLKDITLGDGDMVVLSNQELVNGAATLFYPGLLEQIGDQVGGNFFILPSSTHETILVPDNGSLVLKDLELMVKQINQTELSAKDFLTDTVYHYDSEDRKLEIAQNYQDRKLNLEKQAEKPQERLSIKAQLKDAEKVCGQQVPKPKAQAKETMLE